MKPKFEVGQEVYYIEPNGYYNYELQVFWGKIYEVLKGEFYDNINEEDYNGVAYKIRTSGIDIIEPYVFATEQEAENKLKEILEQ